MGDMIISNAAILEGKDLDIVRGYLEVRNGRIERISEGSPPTWDLNLKGGFILPPLVNAHTHVADSVAKELYLGKEQHEVVGRGGEKFKVLNSTPRTKLKRSIRSTLRYMLRTGTLAHLDFREGGREGIRLLKEASVSEVKTFILGRPSTIVETDEVLDESDGVGLPSLMDHEEDKLELISRKVKRARKLLSSHVAETHWKRKIEIKRAIKLRLSFAVHLTHADEDDLISLHKRGIPIVFCARSNSLLSVGLPPINSAIRSGVKFMLGTDNVGICEPNMFEEMKFAWAYVRMANPKAGEEEALALLKSVTIEPLEHFDIPWGPLEEGGKGTFIVLSRRGGLLDLRHAHAGIVNRVGSENIRAVFLDGENILRARD